MPRTARAIEAGVIYHVLNRGNGRMVLFHKEQDFASFETVLAQALERYPVDLLSYCLMPNHWHLVLRPRRDDALGKMMGWLGVTHVRRHHEHYHTTGSGHLYQGRFKSFPVQDDRHFLTLCRYVEANPIRAGLAKRAADWQWSALHSRRRPKKIFDLSPWPLNRPANWNSLVEAALPKKEIESLHLSVNRGRPFGESSWVNRTADKLGLRFTLRDRGRPRRKNAK